jgi:hypothetical protein
MNGGNRDRVLRQVAEQAPVPQGLQVRGGIIVNPENPALSLLRIEVGPAGYELTLPTENVAPFLEGILASFRQQAGAAPQIARPIPGLFLPNGSGVQPLNGHPGT